MTPDYVTVYQISAASCYSNWPFALAGVLPIFLGLLMIVLKLRFRTPRITWILPIAFCAFGFLWLFTVGWSLLADDANAWKRYQAGDYTTVEGPVQNFSPMPYEGHRNECFSVQSHQFCYSDYVMGAGFHQTASHGGPIRAGMVVRLAY
jgi:hypothetical protein